MISVKVQDYKKQSNIYIEFIIASTILCVCVCVCLTEQQRREGYMVHKIVGVFKVSFV